MGSLSDIMPKNTRPNKESVHDLLFKKASEHATLTSADEAALRSLPFERRSLSSEEDVVCQWDRPRKAVLVLDGMMARYHTMQNGDRQYLSFHIAGDMPDIQSVFLDMMDHSLCALNAGEIALFRHDSLTKLFLKRPGVTFALWRTTLVDAAIFRQMITNNSSRDPASRLAHFCCEQYFRARHAGLADGDSCSLPLNQIQLGQTLGISHISINRALQRLRKDGLLDLRSGKLTIFNWKALVRLSEFDPVYLHVDKESEVSKTAFRGR